MRRPRVSAVRRYQRQSSTNWLRLHSDPARPRAYERERLADGRAREDALQKKRQTADWLRWIVTREGEDKHDRTLTVAFVEVNRATPRLNYRTSSNTRDATCFAKSQQTTCLQRRRSRQSSARSFCSQRITNKSPTSTNSECALEERWRPGTQNTFGVGDHGGVRIRMRRSGVRLVHRRHHPPHPWSRLLRIRFSRARGHTRDGDENQYQSDRIITFIYLYNFWD